MNIEQVVELQLGSIVGSIDLILVRVCCRSDGQDHVMSMSRIRLQFVQSALSLLLSVCLSINGLALDFSMNNISYIKIIT